MPRNGCPRRSHAQGAQPRHGGGHQSLAARLVDGPCSLLDDDRTHAAARRVDGSSEADRPTAHDHYVGVEPHVEGAGSSDSARSSTLIRTISSAALSTVKVSAVSQAV